MTTEREERTFWVWNGYDRSGPRQEVGLATGDVTMWWFPNVGQPGWGTSMQVGYGAFETREACFAYHLAEGKRLLQRSRERLALIKRLMNEGVDL